MLADKLATHADKGVDAVAAEIFAVVRPHAALPLSRSLPPTKPVGNPAIQNGGRYSIALGKRHQQLREKVLRINPRRMADFYGFEKVSQLESCELGDDEFSTAAIKILCEFFFIRREYLEGESNQIFESFDTITSPDDSKKYLIEGFQPYLLCLNEDRRNLWCMPVFHKTENAFDRIITANARGYFASMGGGKSNIVHLIEAAQNRGLQAHDIYVLQVDRKVWDHLENGTFYSKNMNGLRGHDHEAQDCLQKWWDEFVQKSKSSDRNGKNHK